VSALLAGTGWEPVNVDCTVVLDAPKLAPRRPDMEKTLSTAAGAPVTIKGKRTEGLAALAGGVQCHAVALVERR
jgi:2-C-methyl-D-erythritol 2,4-cyclodiphosphate synthase